MIYGQENYYLGLQDQGLEEQRILNHRIISFAKEQRTPLVVSNNVHYVESKDATVHDILLCVESGKVLTDQDRFRFPNDQF